jgi:hypothetical protein
MHSIDKIDDRQTFVAEGAQSEERVNPSGPFSENIGRNLRVQELSELELVQVRI